MFAQRVDVAVGNDDSDDHLDGKGLSIDILYNSLNSGQPSVPSGGSYAADIPSGDLPDDVIIDDVRCFAEPIYSDGTVPSIMVESRAFVLALRG